MTESTNPKPRSNFFVEAAGWYGTVAIVGAYALLSFNVLASDSVWYQLLNLTGALGIIILSWAKGIVQSAVLNLVWAGVAVAALLAIVS